MVYKNCLILDVTFCYDISDAENQKSLNNITINHQIVGPISIPSNGTSIPQ